MEAIKLLLDCRVQLTPRLQARRNDAADGARAGPDGEKLRYGRGVWDVHNQTSFIVERTISVDVDGARHYVVAIKATFHVETDGSLSLLEEQPPVTVAPEFLGEEGASSLLHDGELTPMKRRTDLLVSGHAHAPGGRPTTEVTVGLKTPKGTKALRVRGDRRWERNAVGLVEPTPAQPFVKLPLTWERTYGGFDQKDNDPNSHRMFDANPIGLCASHKGTRAWPCWR